MEVCLASSVRVRRAGLTPATGGDGELSEPLPGFARLVGVEWEEGQRGDIA